MVTGATPMSIEAIAHGPLSEIAGFLGRWRAERPSGTPLRNIAQIERQLKWLLVDNPCASASSRFGYCVRDVGGTLRGIMLSFPAAFVMGDRRLVGLASGSFFVEPLAATAGFFMFKKHLTDRGPNFFFATTCNTNSAPIWRALGAEPIDHTAAEYILPLDLGGLLPTIVAGHSGRRVAESIARAVGRVGSGLMAMSIRRAPQLSLTPCRDWEKLATLFERHRRRDIVTSERTGRFLEWRYGPGSPNHRARIYLTRDQRGNEGWFVVDDVVRGSTGRLRGALLVDWVCPHDQMPADDLLRAVVHVCPRETHAVFLRERIGSSYQRSRFVIRRRLNVPETFIRFSLGARPFGLDALDLVPADGDSAFMTPSGEPSPREGTTAVEVA